MEEIEFWCNKKKIHFTNIYFWKFIYLVTVYKEYRNLLYYRLRRQGVLWGALAAMLMVFLPRMESLQIYADRIGRNLYIEHGVATIISAESIGDFCWINQQVTVGYNVDGKAPVIGNGVRICAGAKVLGGIVVGSNVIVAANAVVLNSVTENSVMAGVPAKFIKQNIEHRLYYGGQ